MFFFHELRRVDGRLQQRPARRCVDRLLAVREEQHDLSRVLAAIGGVDFEELPHGFEAVGDRGLAVRFQLVDSFVDLGRVVRPSHALRRIFRERHHREARPIYAEGEEQVHQRVGEVPHLINRIRVAQGLHRAALIEQQSEVNRRRAVSRGRRRGGARRLGQRRRRRRRRGRRRRGRGWRRRWRRGWWRRWRRRRWRRRRGRWW